VQAQISGLPVPRFNKHRITLTFQLFNSFRGVSFLPNDGRLISSFVQDTHGLVIQPFYTINDMDMTLQAFLFSFAIHALMDSLDSDVPFLGILLNSYHV